MPPIIQTNIQRRDNNITYMAAEVDQERPLQLIQQNYSGLTELHINNNTHRGRNKVGVYWLNERGRSSSLGRAIAINTHLKTLDISKRGILALEVSDSDFFGGLKQNSSINKIVLRCDDTSIVPLIGGVFHEVLKAYQENNNHITCLDVSNTSLRNGGHRIIVNTLMKCMNLKSITLSRCNIRDEHLLPIVGAIRGYSILEELHLPLNRISNAGCEALTTLLRDTNTTLTVLNLTGNALNIEHATTIMNSLFNNTKLRELRLPAFVNLGLGLKDLISRLVCTTSSIDSIYSSNHTFASLLFQSIRGGPLFQSAHLTDILGLNRGTKNKSHVVMKKILKHLPCIDMEPLYAWDSKDEQTLKGLPYVIDWFDRAEEAIEKANDRVNYDYQVETKKLTAIYQFARAMPILFVPPSHTKVDNIKKRKRDDVQA